MKLKILSSQKDQSMVDAIPDVVEVVLRIRSENGKRYFGGAKDRIMAQISKEITDKDMLVNEVEAAFKREESCYFD